MLKTNKKIPLTLLRTRGKPSKNQYSALSVRENFSPDGSLSSISFPQYLISPSKQTLSIERISSCISSRVTTWFFTFVTLFIVSYLLRIYLYFNGFCKKNQRKNDFFSWLILSKKHLFSRIIAYPFFTRKKIQKPTKKFVLFCRFFFSLFVNFMFVSKFCFNFFIHFSAEYPDEKEQCENHDGKPLTTACKFVSAPRCHNRGRHTDKRWD